MLISLRPPLLPLTFIALSTTLVACGGGGDHGDIPAPIDTTATSCFDAALYTNGNSITQRYQEPGFNGSQETFTVAWSFSDTSITFNGQSGLVTLSETRFPDNTRPMSIGYYSKKYYLTPVSTNEIVTHGIDGVFNAALARSEAHEVYTPPSADKKYTLTEGESTQILLQGKKTASSYMNPNDVVTAIDSTTDVTFLGKEKVAIGTRSVVACRFKFVVDGRESLRWYYRGIEIQDASLGGKPFRQTYELTLNSQPY